MKRVQYTLKTSLTISLTILHLTGCGPSGTPTTPGSSRPNNPQPSASARASSSLAPAASPSFVPSPAPTSSSETGVWVQVYFPTSQTTDFQIRGLGSSVTITATDRLGRKQSKSLSTGQAVHTVFFEQLTQGSLTLTFQNSDGSLIGTQENISLGANQGIIVDFSSQTAPQVSSYAYTTLTGRITSPTELALGSYGAVEEVEGLQGLRAAAPVLANAQTVALNTPITSTIYFGDEVAFKVRLKPGRIYKAYLKVTQGNLRPIISSKLVIPESGNNCTGEFITCTRHAITVPTEQDVSFSVTQPIGPFRDYVPKKGDYANFTVNVIDVGSSQAAQPTQQSTPNINTVRFNQRYPGDTFYRFQAGEKVYISFPAQAGKTYTVHLRTKSGDADLWGGRESFFRSNGLKEETSSPGKFDTVNGTALKSNLDPTKRADQYPNQGQFIQKDANGQPDLFYDRVQFLAPATERYVFMINPYQTSEYAFRVEESVSNNQNNTGLVTGICSQPVERSETAKTKSGNYYVALVSTKQGKALISADQNVAYKKVFNFSNGTALVTKATSDGEITFKINPSSSCDGYNLEIYEIQLHSEVIDRQSVEDYFGTSSGFSIKYVLDTWEFWGATASGSIAAAGTCGLAGAAGGTAALPGGGTLVLGGVGAGACGLYTAATLVTAGIGAEVGFLLKDIYSEQTYSSNSYPDAIEGTLVISDSKTNPQWLSDAFTRAITNTVQDTAAHIYTVSKSKARREAANILRANIIAKTGDPKCKEKKTAAHHNVAFGDKRATIARNVLSNCGIDINDGDNGVCLDDAFHRLSDKVTGKGLHRSVEYFDPINTILKKNEGDCNKVRDILRQIGDQLKKGRMDFQNWLPK